MLEVSGLTVRYGPFLALDAVDLDAKAGEIVGVVGPNGAGKSSLVRSIAGLVQPAAGKVTFRGAPLNDVPAHERIRRGLSLVPEGRGLFAQMSVEENLLMGGYILSSAAEVARRMTRCFTVFPVLKERRRQLAGTLSGGQQQMLAVSVGLMCEPKFIILDEPSLGLAPIVIQEIGRTLKAMRAEGLTVLLVEQNARLTAAVADRIYVMHSGRIRYHDTPAALFAKPEVVESFFSV